MSILAWARFRLEREIGRFLDTEVAARMENRRRKKCRRLFRCRRWRGVLPYSMNEVAEVAYAGYWKCQPRVTR